MKRGKQGAATGTVESSPERQRRQRQRRQAQDERWAARASPVTVRQVGDDDAAAQGTLAGEGRPAGAADSAPAPVVSGRRRGGRGRSGRAGGAGGASWSQEETAQLVARYESGMTPSDVAAQVGRSPRAVENRLRQLGLWSGVGQPVEVLRGTTRR